MRGARVFLEANPFNDNPLCIVARREVELTLEGFLCIGPSTDTPQYVWIRLLLPRFRISLLKTQRVCAT